MFGKRTSSGDGVLTQERQKAQTDPVSPKALHAVKVRCVSTRRKKCESKTMGHKKGGRDAKKKI